MQCEVPSTRSALDGAHLGQNCSATLQRRVLWSHIVHQDREWSVLFGRPMTEIPFSTTPAPTLQDYLNCGLELACAQYLVVRDSFAFTSSASHASSRRSQPAPTRHPVRGSTNERSR